MALMLASRLVTLALTMRAVAGPSPSTLDGYARKCCGPEGGGVMLGVVWLAEEAQVGLITARRASRQRLVGALLPGRQLIGLGLPGGPPTLAMCGQRERGEFALVCVGQHGRCGWPRRGPPAGGARSAMGGGGKRREIEI